MSAKKYLSVILSIVILLLSAGCNKSITTSNNSTAALSSTSPSESSSDTTTQTTETSTEKITEIDKDFFDDAVFIGDSLTVGLMYYATSQRNLGKNCLGKAKFLCEESMGFTNLIRGGSHAVLPVYQGRKVTVEEGIRLCGAKKVFIMLGMNDFSGYDRSVTEGCIRELIDRIKASNPDVEIYIESVTPIVASRQHDSFTNENIESFNALLQSICDEYGLQFIDVASQMKDENGNLKPSFCSDPNGLGIHMLYPGTEVWTNYLMDTFEK